MIDLIVSLADGVSGSIEALGKSGEHDEDMNQFVGWLVGVHEVKGVSVLSMIGRQGGDIQEDLDSVCRLLPVGLEVVGACAPCTSDAAAGSTAHDIAQTQQALSKATGESLPIVAVVASASVTFFQISAAGSVKAIQTRDLGVSADDWLIEHYTLLRCSLPCTLQVVGASGSGTGHAVRRVGATTADAAIADAFEAIRAELCSEATTFVAEARAQQVTGEARQILLGSGNEEAACSSLAGSQPISVSPFLRRQNHGTAAPIMTYQPYQSGPVSFTTTLLALDILWYVSKTQQLSTMNTKPLRTGLSRQLDWMQLEMQRSGDIGPLSAFHFQPTAAGQKYTIVYPLSTSASVQLEAVEEKLTGLRRKLHERLCLPTDRPLLRASNSLQFGTTEGDASRTSILKDVHLGLGPSGVVGGRVHMIWGSYNYHHYMQGRMDDSGWGCAYRSLQTICSWFQLQHFTSRPVPTHREIQQILVDIGDKQRSFVGSKQWIGAIELSYILDSLLNVTSKVITVSAGAEMDQKAREIAHHFDTQGTPIMIGGGVLAYTLLGIDFNPATGDCAFLILDPHYTGADDLKRIQGGQWVAWKRSNGKAAAGGNLFVQDAFYNLLCPQLPSII